MKSMQEAYQEVCEATELMREHEKQHYGFAPQEASKMLQQINFDRIEDMTRILFETYKRTSIKNEKSPGNIVVYYIVLGGLVEGWMRFFFSMYALDYKKNPLKDNNKTVKFEKLTFDNMNKYIKNNIWNDPVEDANINIWLEKIRYYRNTVHIYLNTDIGTGKEAKEDFIKFSEYVHRITNRLPDLPSNFF